jgi:hypothetical protein
MRPQRERRSEVIDEAFRLRGLAYLIGSAAEAETAPLNEAACYFIQRALEQIADEIEG